MKYFRLIWKNIWRKKIRTSLTRGCSQCSSHSYCRPAVGDRLLRSVGGVENIGCRAPDRYRQNFADPTPCEMAPEAALRPPPASRTHPGSAATTERRPVSGRPAVVLRDVSHFKMPAEQLEAWKKNRIGAVVGPGTRDHLWLESWRPDPLAGNDLDQERWRSHGNSSSDGIFSSDDPRGSTALMCFPVRLLEKPGFCRRSTSLVRTARGERRRSRAGSQCDRPAARQLA